MDSFVILYDLAQDYVNRLVECSFRRAPGGDGIRTSDADGQPLFFAHRARTKARRLRADVDDYCFVSGRVDAAGGAHASPAHSAWFDSGAVCVCHFSSSPIFRPSRARLVFPTLPASLVVHGWGDHVPAVYLGWAILANLAERALCEISNLRAFNEHHRFESLPLRQMS